MRLEGIKIDGMWYEFREGYDLDDMGVRIRDMNNRPTLELTTASAADASCSIGVATGSDCPECGQAIFPCPTSDDVEE